MANLNDELKTYIEVQLQKGQSLNEIKSNLINLGWKPAIVENHINYYLKKPRAKPVMKPIFIFLLLFLLAILVFYFFYPKQSISLNKEINDYIDIGDRLCLEGGYQKAQQQFDKAIKLNESKARGYFYKGKCYVIMKNYSEAILQLNKALSLYRRNPAYYYYLGVGYCKSDLYDQGISNLNKAVQMNRTNINFYRTLAECYLASGDKENSLLWLNKSLSIQK